MSMSQVQQPSDEQDSTRQGEQVQLTLLYELIPSLEKIISSHFGTVSLD